MWFGLLLPDTKPNIICLLSPTPTWFLQFLFVIVDLSLGFQKIVQSSNSCTLSSNPREVNADHSLLPVSPFSSQKLPFNLRLRSSTRWDYASFSPLHRGHVAKPIPCFAVSKKSDSEESGSKPEGKRRTRTRRTNAEEPAKEGQNPERNFPTTIPRKPRRGRRSEAVAVEDFIRDSLERTFESIREQHPDAFEKEGKILKDRVDDEMDCSSSDKEDSDDEELEDGEDDDGMSGVKGKKQKMVVEEESSSWPLDADVGWGIRASEYFEKHAIKNVVGDDGVEIDWEGEIDDNWVNEINCLEWERFAFHPSPLVVLVFERYDRATLNWNTLKELEKAAEVYRNAKDRLPPRTVKIDINIERDLAYALKVKECPQVLFLRGNRILYREKEFRTADELVQMIAHFYYNAKRPSCVNKAAILSPY